MIPTDASILPRIVDAIRSTQRFVISSHSRPDGDSIGSQLAMAYALRALGKHVTIVNKDAAPAPIMAFPGVETIVIADRVIGEFDAAIIMECSDLDRTGVAGLDRAFLINIDHHPGNTEYGQINWFDSSAAACGEMVFDLVRALDVPLSLIWTCSPRDRISLRRCASRFSRAACSPRRTSSKLPTPRLPARLRKTLPHLRHLQGDARGGRRRRSGRTEGVRQQQHGETQIVRRGVERDADRSHGTNRHRPR